MALALLLAESLIRGYQIPVGLIPTPSRVAQTLTETWQALLQDARQTFLNEVLLGFVGGVLAGLLVALLLVRFKFLAQGLLPYLTAASSIPIVGIAPVLVASLGSDWPSKAAIAAIVCFFPIAINTFRGLTAVDRQQLDLMHSYGASMSQTFTYLRLPGAQPYLFTGLKVAAPLALISAIVGEFFGSPARGLGFRIKLEAGRFGFDVVWAAIVYASVLGLLFYGFIALLERLITHWHSSIREA
ncbi:ABC transporter permease [Leptolyngbya sp. FACHB-261]|nr:ABC transporter permease [Leptolyngbya sp. FACHB-261]